MEPIRVLIVDDHRSFAEAIGIRLAAEPEFVLLRTCRTAAEAESAVAALRPDVVLVDVELGRDDGIALVNRLRLAVPTTACIVVTFRDDVATASASLRAGAAGFVAKDATPSELVDAIRIVAAGGRWIQPRLLGPVLDELTQHPGTLTPEQQKLATLSERELEVLQYMVRGMDRKTIARHMYLSANTVRTHTRNLLAKLELHSSLEAVAFALRAGMRPGDGDPSPSPSARREPPERCR